MPLDCASLCIHSKILTAAWQRSPSVTSKHALAISRAISTLKISPLKDLLAKAATPSESILRFFIFYYWKKKEWINEIVLK